MQLALAAPRCAPRRLAAVAAALASAVVSATLTFGGAHAAALPTEPVPAPQVADATDGTGSACTGQPAYKAVIVVGPVDSATAQFTGWANAIASAAKDAGMSVCKVYTPDADADTVRTAAKGADLFVTLMHGNGYPHSTSGGKAAGDEPNDGNDATAHGLGLNASKGSSKVRYYGANWVEQYLHLAPGAVVMLSHMCYTSGNSEDADPIPTYQLAIDHVDNFAQGFLQSTATGGGRPSVVMALQSQSFDLTSRNLFTTLMTSSVTMDQAFMKSYGANTRSWAGSYIPNFGAVGTSDFYATARSDGSALRGPGRIHIDPDLATSTRTAPTGWDPNALTPDDIAWLDSLAGKPKGIKNPGGDGLARFGYVRSIAGDLGFKTASWRAVASVGTTPDPTPTPAPTSPQPPALTSLKASQGAGTGVADADALPVFTPNGDGTSDKLRLTYKANRAATLKVSITNSAGAKVRAFTVAAVSGASSFTWNGKSDAGKVVPDGTYTLTAKISGGNTRSVRVKSLTAIKVPVTSRTLLNASDGDDLARTARQSVAVRTTSTITWVIRDAAGDVVRTGLDHRRVSAGTTSWTWDGKDDAGRYVKDGTYGSVVTAATSKGSYSLRTTIGVMAYRVTGDFSQRPGQWNTLAVEAAESQRGTPSITVKQPGLPSYRLTLKHVSTDRWSAVWKARSGAKGTVTFTIAGTDVNGGKDSRTWKGTIQ